MKTAQKLSSFDAPVNLLESKLFTQMRERFTQGDGELMYAGALLQYAARTYPEQIAVVCRDKNITYRELYFRAAKLSEKLIKNGVEQGERVCMLFENSIEFFIAYFGIWQAGAVCVPLNTFLHERELRSIVLDAQPAACIASANLRAPLDAALEAASYTLRAFFTEEAIDFTSPVPSHDELFATSPVKTLPKDELCLLLYTSGTTGEPKGVMLSSHNIMSNVLADVARRWGWKGDSETLHQERFFAALPLFHVFAQNTCLWMPVMVGATIIVVPKVDRREILTGLGNKPTIFFGVPALYGLLCMMKTAPLDSVKFFISGGDALPDRIREAFGMIYGRKIAAGYGLTEAAPVVGVYIENDERPTDVIGYPLAGITAQIRNDDGTALGSEVVGNIWIKGDNVMLGYYNCPQETAHVLKDGWLNTGDIGLMRRDGMLTIRGRHKDLIIHKGFNIYPQEIENILMSHPQVYKAAVLGREDEASGQIPIAFVALREQGAEVYAHLQKHCAEHLAAYKIPRTFIYRDDLPMNTTGKIDKKVLKNELV